MKRALFLALAIAGAIAIACSSSSAPHAPPDAAEHKVGGPIGPTGGSLLSVTGSANGGLAGGGSAGNVTLGLRPDCSPAQTLLWNGTGWVCGTGGIGGSGSAGYPAVWTGSSSLGSGTITADLSYQGPVTNLPCMISPRVPQTGNANYDPVGVFYGTATSCSLANATRFYVQGADNGGSFIPGINATGHANITVGAEVTFCNEYGTADDGFLRWQIEDSTDETTASNRITQGWSPTATWTDEIRQHNECMTFVWDNVDYVGSGTSFRWAVKSGGARIRQARQTIENLELWPYCLDSTTESGTIDHYDPTCEPTESGYPEGALVGHNSTLIAMGTSGDVVLKGMVVTDGSPASNNGGKGEGAIRCITNANGSGGGNIMVYWAASSNAQEQFAAPLYWDQGTAGLTIVPGGQQCFRSPGQGWSPWPTAVDEWLVDVGPYYSQLGALQITDMPNPTLAQAGGLNYNVGMYFGELGVAGGTTPPFDFELLDNRTWDTTGSAETQDGIVVALNGARTSGANNLTKYALYLQALSCQPASACYAIVTEGGNEYHGLGVQMQVTYYDAAEFDINGYANVEGNLNVGKGDFSGQPGGNVNIYGAGSSGNLVLETAGAYVQLVQQSGTATTPRLYAYAGNPNSHISCNAGDFCLDSSTPALWQCTGGSAWEAPLSPGTFNDEDFGGGADGSITFDGVGSNSCSSLVGSTYTLTRDCFPASATVSSGVTIVEAGYGLFVQGALGGSGTIANNGLAGTTGGNGSGATNVRWGASGVGSVPGGGATGPGDTPNPFIPTSSGGAAGCPNGATGTLGAGGGGGSGGASCGAANSGTPGAGSTQMVAGNLGPLWKDLLRGHSEINNIQWNVGAGGGAGGNCTGGGTRGGGGGGGGLVVVAARQITGALVIEALGGNGGAGTGQCGGGGGGSGGFLLIKYVTNPGGATFSVAGGSGAAGFLGSGGNGGLGAKYIVNLSGDGT